MINNDARISRIPQNIVPLASLNFHQVGRAFYFQYLLHTGYTAQPTTAGRFLLSVFEVSAELF